MPAPDLPPDDMPNEPRWRRYLRFWRADPRADVRDELRFHLEARVAENLAAGMSPDDARRLAAERFGDVSAVEQSLASLTRERETIDRRVAWRQVIAQDLRFAVRQLARNPVFTGVAVITLALGIGANTAIFSAVYSVLLRPLPYAHADRLVELREGAQGGGSMNVTAGNYDVWRQRSPQFSALGAYWYGSFTLTGIGAPQRLFALDASADYWRALYIPPVIGRYFGSAEDQPGAPNVVVLSYALWSSTFASDPHVVGRVLTLNGNAYTVVGVAPAAYAFTPTAPQIWVPLALTPEQRAEHADHELTVVGLLRDGTALPDAIRELSAVQGELAHDYPRGGIDGSIVGLPLRDSVVGAVRPMMLVLFGAVGLVLLIACGNVMNLLLARASVRRKEVAIRSALGAGRARLVAQLLTESVLLAALGGVAGVAVAALGLHALLRVSPGGVPRLGDATLDAPVLLFAAIVALACGVVFGVWPALRATRLDLQQALREGSRESSSAVRGSMRTLLVIGEVSLALVLLVGAGLLVRSAIALQRVPPGFDPNGVLVANVALPAARYPTDSAMTTGFERIAQAVQSVPGAVSVALASRVPIAQFGMDCTVRRDGSTPDDGSGVDANMRSATGNYFGTMRTPLLRGRTFGIADVASAAPVVVINQSLAHRLFGDADPIGRRITHCSADAPVWRQVVGVVADMRASGLEEPPPNEVFYPVAQLPFSAMSLVIRSPLPPASLAPLVRRAVAGVDPELAVSGVATMDEIVARSMATPRFTTTLLVLLGLTGLALAAVGIYGIIAYFVSQRAHEIGVRMALGATQRGVSLMVLRQGLALAGAGVAIGLVASVATTRALAGMVYGVGTRDPVTFVVVAGLLLLVAALASVVPAHRATRLDPLEALRGG
ncbi:MAG TPA: ABC transporter permease [Gemmatimonadaceae bacterium]